MAPSGSATDSGRSAAASGDSANVVTINPPPSPPSSSSLSVAYTTYSRLVEPPSAISATVTPRPAVKQFDLSSQALLRHAHNGGPKWSLESTPTRPLWEPTACKSKRNMVIRQVLAQASLRLSISSSPQTAEWQQFSMCPFLQRVSIACYAERCISYDRFCLTV